jgi:hypothetical protein
MRPRTHILKFGDLTMQKIVVTSSSPLSRFCANTHFTGAMVFDLNHFDGKQLRAIIADRLLTVVVGEVLTEDRVDELLDYAAEVTMPKAGDTFVSATDEIKGPAELVSGLAVYPAGSQAAVLPAEGGPLVDPGNAGTVDQAPHIPPVVAHGHHKGKAAK